ncbi:multidrug efflux RND transporter permease subunit [Parasutterella excrementihominis]|uniref:efflux RND transporter permease subunit n=1 Tax=Parasutterella excrementihominis TaxID=487175 RepID=UPI0012BD5D83|nr:multidrug efflux RND transporter permease subunit [Parasutterella excrementihominis]MTT73070.1 multidrug efflux RND transporter permease subunit [Parasutterella excrementihominis]MTT96849.1 multidrug efflux RND transporter permease subunit [Parasutterella excrementihominis]MTU05958.1 multidrug efflux RND transporter permease subunit [Parasutterella excrementihominis]MTU11022.1 multidrug efflux RND transporter permease subunit [Parasutterella excrementihominis]MTU26000.1 multidrug efflux RND
MLSQFCIRRPIFASVLSILIVIAGLLAGRVLPMGQYPDITPPVVFISTSYEGADAQTLAKTVAAPIEDQLSGVEGLLYYETSIRSNGNIRITCTFEVGTNPNDAMLEINNRVRSAERRLPESVRQNGVNVRKRSEETLMIVPFYSPNGTLKPIQLADYVNLNVVDAIKRVPGVGDADVFGNAQSAMRIWLNPKKMAQLGITAIDVRKAIEEQNHQYAAGKVGTSPTTDDQQLVYTIRTKGQLLTPEEFGNITVRSRGADGIVRIHDTARVEVGNRSYEAYNQLNDVPSVTFAVYLQTGANAMQTAVDVRKRLQELSKNFPDDIAYVITDDNSRFVEAALNEVVQTLLEAGLLVLLVVYLFLQNWRATLIPMLAVPVSLIGTLAGLWALNFSLNTLTLFAMTLAIGIVVDDAIVVLENVERIMETEKLNAFQASQKAMKEVAGALVAIVLVLSTVFTPVAFLGGIAGELYRQFAVTIGVSVVLSGFVALTLTPALCAILLRHKSKPFKIFQLFNDGFERFKLNYIKGVSFNLRHRWFTAAILVAVTVGCWEFLQIVPTSFVPREDQGILRVAIQLPEGATLNRTGVVVTDLSRAIRKIPEVENVTALVANDTIANDTKSNAASLIVQLKPWDQRTRSAETIRRQLQTLVNARTDAVGQAVNPAPIRGLGRAGGLDFYIQSRESDNPLELQQVAEDFRQRLVSKPEISSARSMIQADAPQLYLTVDEAKALAMGVAISDVYDTLGYFMGGKYVNDFTRIGKIFRVIIQADAPYRMTPESLGELYVRSDTGKMVPLSTLAHVERTSGPESLKRENGFLAASMNVNAAQGYSTGDVIRTVDAESQYLPSGYYVDWTGQAFHEKRIGSSSAAAFAFGLIIVFLILAAQFERWSLPIAVVMAVPYSVLGALVATYFRGFSNDIYFQIGLLVLIGLTAKNAILIVEFAAQKMEEGMEARQAALEAAKLRLRPIVMTSMAFILGVIPLATATGAGAAARQSMGTGVLGGMLAATFITTFFIPVFFTWFVSKKIKARR